MRGYKSACNALKHVKKAWKLFVTDADSFILNTRLVASLNTQADKMKYKKIKRIIVALDIKESVNFYSRV